MPREMFARRRIDAKGLSHTYTRMPQVLTQDDPTTLNVDESHDLWGSEVATHPASARVPAQPCAYSDRQVLVRVGDGSLLVRVPSLIVRYDDPLQVGDWVSNVQTRSGQVLLAGPAEVEEIPPSSPSGEVLQKVARLRAVQAQI